MNWVKPSQSTLDYFERLAPGAPLETRKMFGLPSRFLNGYMLVGVFGNALVLHLSETDRKECVTAGAAPFKPMGREMKAYVAIKPGHFEDHDLKWWIVRGMRHIGTLEPRLSAPVPVRRAKAPLPVKKKSKKAAKPAKAKKSRRKVGRRPVVNKAARTAPKPTKKTAKRRTVARKQRPAPKKRRTRR